MIKLGIVLMRKKKFYIYLTKLNLVGSSLIDFVEFTGIRDTITQARLIVLIYQVGISLMSDMRFSIQIFRYKKFKLIQNKKGYFSWETERHW